MREREPELSALNVRVYAVTFESAARVRDYRANNTVATGFPILRDPRREAYREFGLGRQGVESLANVRTLAFYARQTLRGRLPRLHASDFGQLGGDVLLDAEGSAAWIYSSREPADRPSVDDIVRELKRL